MYKLREIMLNSHKYKVAFSLRDEIGTCPSIQVAIDIMDKSPFFIRPYHVKDAKTLTDKEMKCLCYLGILKAGFPAYSSPVRLISRKVTQDKRVVTHFRQLKVRIAKNNLAYPLLEDTLSVLGSSKCKVLSVLDLKDAFLSLRLWENSKKILQNTSILLQCILSITENAHWIKYFTLNLTIIHKCNIRLLAK